MYCQSKMTHELLNPFSRDEYQNATSHDDTTRGGLWTSTTNIIPEYWLKCASIQNEGRKYCGYSWNTVCDHF